VNPAIRFLLIATILASTALGTLFPADPEAFFSPLRYRFVGPSRGGRVTAVAGHKDRPSEFYLGSTGGGVWKTSDYGLNWYPISDGYFATPSIGAIQVAPSNPDIVYVGTGTDGWRSNLIIGKGMYKSTDAGETWRHIGLEKTGSIGAVIVHPTNPDLVYAAAIGNPFQANSERGVFRSRDGGNTWSKVLFISEKTGVVDLEFAPFDPEEIYAAAWQAERKPWTIISGGYEGGLFKSDDGGETWRKLGNQLPEGLIGKADLAVSPDDPDRVYALIEAPGDQGGVYRSNDRGRTWEQVTDFQPIRNRPFYYCNLEADPRDADILWGMAEGFYRSDDGGKTWSRRSVPHGDNHDMWINPDHPEIFIQANDGGANVTLDGGKTWSTQYNQPTAELYQVNVSDEFPYRLYAGQQDNSTISVPSWPSPSRPGGFTALWESHGGCETGPVIPKPGDPDIVYANCKGRFGVYNRRTGQEMQYYVGMWNLYGHNPRDLAYRFQRVAPIHVSPHDPNRVYHGSQFVHVTTDGGQTWETISPDLTAFTSETQVVSGSPITIDVTGEEHFSTLYEIQESPHEPGVIWTGANDGPIHVTRDGGKNWKEVTPPELGPYGRVQNIEVSPHDPAKAYVAVLRYQLGDFQPYAFKTTDYGATWKRITTGNNGIPPDCPVRVVREDPDREGLLYAGTEWGVYLSFDDGAGWSPFQLNLPVTPVTDIQVVNGDLVLSTMGRGFWILYDLSPIRGYRELPQPPRPHLFAVKDAYRLYIRSGRSGSPALPDYPPVGVNLDYFLPESNGEEVRIEILSASGSLIRAFTSRRELADESVTHLTEPSPGGQRRSSPARPLSASPGFHRFVWNLRYPGAWGENPSRSLGPMVPPGEYRVRLRVGSEEWTQDFRLRMDPRVTAEGITGQDVEEQAKLALQVRDRIGEARKTALRVLELLREREGIRQLEDLRDELITPPVRYSRPRIIDQLKYLYGALMRADQRPGRDAYVRFEELSRQLESCRKLLGEIS